VVSASGSQSQLSHSFAQSVEFPLKVLHTLNVGSHFVVNILDAAVNVRNLLCHVCKIPDPCSRSYNSLQAPQTGAPPRPLYSSGATLAFWSLVAGLPRGSRKSTFSA
jgi:hypothetical protein